MLHRLIGIVDSGLYGRTAYLSPGSLSELRDRGTYRPTIGAVGAGLIEELPGVLEHVGESDTGLALFWRDDEALAVVPPFPLADDRSSEGTDVSVLVRLLTSEPLVGIVLLRLGRYAVGVLQGERLVASKAGTRYVKSRHRAGGSSQRRFERSRERLVRELFDAACEVARDVFAPFASRLDHLLLGGERHTLQRFVRRCPVVQRLDPMTLRRTLQVDRPGQKAMQGIADEVWTSRVIVFKRTESD